MFMNTTLRAAVHLEKEYDTNLHYAKNHLWDNYFVKETNDQ